MFMSTVYPFPPMTRFLQPFSETFVAGPSWRLDQTTPVAYLTVPNAFAQVN